MFGICSSSNGEKNRKESGKMTCSTLNIHRTAAEQIPNEKRKKEMNTKQKRISNELLT